MIDWNGALEAVHTDGRVAAIDQRDTSKRTTCTWWVQLEGRAHIVGPLGQCYGTGWTIRNVVAQRAWRTSDEQLDRMDALVRRIRDGAGKGVRMNATEELSVVAEAKAILAAREPVDPRFNTVHAVILRNHLVTDDAARHLARVVLAALDA